MSIYRVLLVAIACSVWQVVPARSFAQAPRTLRGTLSASSPVSEVLRPGHYHNLHKVYLYAGQRYTIDLESSDFDAYLFLLDGQRHAVAENDDAAAGTTNSRVAYVPGVSGFYEVVATSFQKSDVGSYTITIRSGAETIRPPARLPGMPSVAPTPPQLRPVPASLPQLKQPPG